MRLLSRRQFVPSHCEAPTPPQSSYRYQAERDEIFWYTDMGYLFKFRDLDLELLKFQGIILEYEEYDRVCE